MALTFLSKCGSTLLLPSREPQRTPVKTVVSLTSSWAADAGRWGQGTGEDSPQGMWDRQPSLCSAPAAPQYPGGHWLHSLLHTGPGPVLTRAGRQVEEAELTSHEGEEDQEEIEKSHC